jgi:hypothetical protein
MRICILVERAEMSESIGSGSGIHLMGTGRIDRVVAIVRHRSTRVIGHARWAAI